MISFGITPMNVLIQYLWRRGWNHANWPEKLNGKAKQTLFILFTPGRVSSGVTQTVDHLHQIHLLCLLHVDLYFCRRSGHNFWQNVGNLLIWKIPQVRLMCFCLSLLLIIDHHWLMSITVFYSLFPSLKMHPLLKITGTELSFLISWGIIHELSIWILRKFSI